MIKHRSASDFILDVVSDFWFSCLFVFFLLNKKDDLIYMLLKAEVVKYWLCHSLRMDIILV